MPEPVLTRLTAVAPASVMADPIVKAAPVLCWWTKSSPPVAVSEPPDRPEVAVATVGVTSKPPDCKVSKPARFSVAFAVELKRRALAVAPAATLPEASASTLAPVAKVLP